MSKAGIVLIFAGAVLAIFSHPRIGPPIVARLANEGIITPKLVKPEKAEILKYAGPRLSLFILGIIIIVFGILIL